MNERREADRKRVYIGGRIVHRHILSDTNCLLRNLSAAGARVVVNAAIPLPNRFDIVVDSRGTRQAVEAIWRKGDEMGIRFVTDAPERTRAVDRTDGFEGSLIELPRPRARIADIALHARPAEGALH